MNLDIFIMIICVQFSSYYLGIKLFLMENIKKDPELIMNNFVENWNAFKSIYSCYENNGGACNLFYMPICSALQQCFRH
jgi:hypothetical protein